MVCCRVLGFDREPVLGAATAQEILPFLAASGELEPLLAVANLAVATTILFSAKESLFKALSGALGDFADFTAARLVGCIPGGIQLRLSIDWGDAWPAGTVLPIQVAREADAVETLLHVRP